MRTAHLLFFFYFQGPPFYQPKHAHLTGQNIWAEERRSVVPMHGGNIDLRRRSRGSIFYGVSRTATLLKPLLRLFAVDPVERKYMASVRVSEFMLIASSGVLSCHVPPWRGGRYSDTTKAQVNHRPS
jgi:hypothetical protein